MDPSEDETFKKDYTKYKLIVKEWEKQFFKRNERIPSKHDIKEAHKDVRRAYSRYFQMKSQMLERAVADVLPVSPPALPIINTPSPLPSASPLKHLPSVSEIEQLMSSKEQTNHDDTLPVNSSKVWGSHLNFKAKKFATKPVNKVQTISQTLFKSCSFNKRNPRKSINRSQSQIKIDSNNDLSQVSCASIDDSVVADEIDVSFGNCSLPVNNKNESQHNVMNPIHSLSFSAKPTLRTIDKSWLDRCSDSIQNETISNDSIQINDFSNNTCEINKFGLKNVNVELFKDNIDNELDCIANSESENEDTNKKFQRIRVVKKQKLDNSQITSLQNTSPKTDAITQMEISASTESDEVKPKKRKAHTRKVNKKAPPKKSTRIKRKKKIETSEDDEVDNNSDEEINRLNDIKVKMPRFAIKASVLKENNIIDGLATALELPKSFKNKKKDSANSLKTAEDKMEAKIKNGTLNENFVRINIEKKVFVRGKKSVNYSKFKKQQWKNKTKALNELGPEFPEGGILKCFKCGETGHFSRYCKAHKGNDLLPLDNTVESSPHQTLAEAGGSKLEKIELDDNFLFKPIQDEDENSDVLNVKHKTKIELVPETFLKLLEAPSKSNSFTKTIEPLYPLTDVGKLRETPQEVFKALHMFGHNSFREGQELAVMRILSGKSTLLTLTTGSGKSLCYQLPAYIYAQHNKCITLVISPLVSLMEDQVVNMPGFVRAGCLHTNQTPTNRQKIIDLIKDGEINVLLLSPEAIVSGERSTGFGSILKQLPPIAFACIDEVHCVSQWSHNFRPSYLVICRVLKEKMGVKCILGLTATATATSTKSIMEHIGVDDGMDGVITNLPVPDNLILTVSRDNLRDRAIVELLMSDRFKDCNSLIVYCIRRDECERIAGLIRTAVPNFKENISQDDQEINQQSGRKRKRFNWLVEAYHAGMSAAKRRRVQQAFMNGDLKIVVATVAFGMGINKSDIRGVIHYNMPSSFESYVQEVGRAGRDGLIAQCHAFIDNESKDKYELLRHIHANSIERHVIRKLLQKVFIPCACKKMMKKIENDDESNYKCQGHEVAFAVDETVSELDLPAENICTLLCYLELHPNKYIKLLSNVYIMCKMISYGGPSALFNAAKRCPPLAMAIALEKNKGISFENLSVFEFCVIDVAAAIGWQSGMVKYHLKNLEWDKQNDRVKRSMLKVEFNTLGFHIMAPGDLDPVQLDIALDSLYERTQLQEKTMLNQLYQISKTLIGVSYSNISECINSDLCLESSKTLRKQIQDYFIKESHQNEDVVINDKPVNENQIIADVRGLVCAYKDCTFTGRAIARIFQGINSPNYPAVVWGRCRYWRSHLYDDFYKLSEIAKQQIMLMR